MIYELTIGKKKYHDALKKMKQTENILLKIRICGF